jgi:uncharacterized protein (TIGR03663 family)
MVAFARDCPNRSAAGVISATWERVAWCCIAGLAFWTRLVDLGVRAMSHDESMHAYYSYLLYATGSYQHDPGLHGPALFHLNALTYLLAGDSDFTARLVPTLSGIALILFLYAFRRFLGSCGALAGALMVLISPSLLFYSRYLVLDVFVILASLAWTYGAFRYLAQPRRSWLYLLVFSMALFSTAKENVFIFGAGIGSFFLALAIFRKRSRALYPDPRHAADLAWLMLTLVIPFLAPGLHLLLGWGNAIFRPQPGLGRSLALAMVLTGVAVIIAFLRFDRAIGRQGDAPVLNFQFWARLMVLFWVIQILLFTTFLTNLVAGLGSGIVGSLSYWIEQHGVRRGNAPWFYYLIQGLLYEFLPILAGALGAVSLLRIVRRSRHRAGLEFAPVPDGAPSINSPEGNSRERLLFGIYALWWAASSWICYSAAGERMPWLMVHITFPTILLGSWWLGRIAESAEWKKTSWPAMSWVIVSVPLLLWYSATLFTTRPFTGRSLDSVQATLGWVTSLMVLVGILALVFRARRRHGSPQLLCGLTLGAAAALILGTIRCSGMLNYQNYDLATELLVYAHATPDIKLTLSELEAIPNRATDGDSRIVCYDDESSWPFSWYFRRFPGTHFYGRTPDSSLSTSPAVIVGPKNYDKVRPLMGANYIKRTRRLIWWPTEQYYNLTPARIWSVLRTASGREELRQIILFRHYPNSSLREWPQRHEFELYLRQDVAARIWGPSQSEGRPGGSPEVVYQFVPQWLPVSIEAFHGVYAGKSLRAPRDVTVSRDGTIFVADTGNDRVLALDRKGKLVRSIGRRCNLEQGAGGGCTDEDGSGPLTTGDGQFLEPWGVAASGSGEMYVADTWNSRVQAFDSSGRLLWKWGSFGSTAGLLAEPRLLYGPRGLAVSPAGDLLVADTGNKRLLRLSGSGEFLGQGGGNGAAPGRLNEPVGIAFDPETGDILVADEWNQRIQRLNSQWSFLQEWRVPGWTDRNASSKPYVAVDARGDVFATDPGTSRVLVFDRQGRLHHFIHELSPEYGALNQPAGIYSDLLDNSLWIADSGNHRILRLQLPSLDPSRATSK